MAIEAGYCTQRVHFTILSTLYIFEIFQNKMLKMYIHINIYIPKAHSWIYEGWQYWVSKFGFFFLKKL